ncbi:MAG TPA: aminotransferase class IV, partial [Candidatus Norongarragalinales archaeon]|nr:aminotransferase class IV [Candidatus Norongarragalinales archaeon]
MQKRFLFNGKIVEQGQAVISAANKAAFFGYGVYESIRVFRGKPFYLEWHLKRFFESARAIEIEVPYSPEELSALTRSLIEKNNLDDALIRLV